MCRMPAVLAAAIACRCSGNAAAEVETADQEQHVPTGEGRVQGVGSE